MFASIYLSTSHLFRPLPHPALWPPEDEDDPLAPGSAVGRPHRKVPEAVLVRVPQAGQREPEASLGLLSVPYVPLPELVLQKKIH